MRWKAPANVDGISIENQQFEVGPVETVRRDGEVDVVQGVDVPDHLDHHMPAHGFTRLVAPPVADDPAPSPVVEEKIGLAKTGDLKKMIDPALVAKMKEIKRMSGSDLRVWLVNHGVDVSALTTKPQRFEAALRHIGWVEPEPVQV